jgi:electron transfer flavoprotein beta subunit
MKVLVPVKRVVDYSVKIRLKADGSGVETAQVKMSMNPFDEIAVEEALRLREQGVVSEIVVISVGERLAQEMIRTALAMGADRGLLYETEEVLYPLEIAKILKHVVLTEQVSLVLLGKQAIDSDNNQTGQMLAGLLGWPQATFASHITFDEGENPQYLQVASEMDEGLQTVRMRLPAVITTDLRLNEPRYATLPNIMKAKQKPLEVRTLASLMAPGLDLGLKLDNRPEILSVTLPTLRQGGMEVSSVSELLSKLHNVERVI